MPAAKPAFFRVSILQTARLVRYIGKDSANACGSLPGCYGAEKTVMQAKRKEAYELCVEFDGCV